MSIALLFGPFAGSGGPDVPALAGASTSSGSLEMIHAPTVLDLAGASTSVGTLIGALGASILTPFDELILDLEALIETNRAKLALARATATTTDDTFWVGQVQLAGRALEAARRARAISVRIRG